LSLPADLDLLEAEMVRHDVALLVVDPLMSVIGSNIDTHKERDTRTALDPLARLADRTGAVVLGIAHFSKASGSDASSLITGSGAFKNVARSIFGFARDQEDGSRVFSQVKNSLGRDHHDLPSLSYEISDVVVETAKGDAHVGRFHFSGLSEQSVHEALSGSRPGYSARDAETWLTEYLTEAGGTAPSKEIKEAAKEEGISNKILRKARESLKVVIEQSGFPKVSTWSLASAPVMPSGAHSGPPPQLTRLGTTGGAGMTASQDTAALTATESSDAA
ncbi:AAA family ATPase, partial [Frankia sp. AvcI1]